VSDCGIIVFNSDVLTDGMTEITEVILVADQNGFLK
jgi:hypothetical protein